MFLPEGSPVPAMAGRDRTGGYPLMPLPGSIPARIPRFSVLSGTDAAGFPGGGISTGKWAENGNSVVKEKVMSWPCLFAGKHMKKPVLTVHERFRRCGRHWLKAGTISLILRVPDLSVYCRVLFPDPFSAVSGMS